MEYYIEVYTLANKHCPFSDWLDELVDIRARAAIRVRINRLRIGNFGVCEPVGEGVSELKIDFGPGYRVYFGKIGKRCVLLLCGGNKRSQKSDIKLAKDYFNDFKAGVKNVYKK